MRLGGDRGSEPRIPARAGTRLGDRVDDTSENRRKPDPSDKADGLRVVPVLLPLWLAQTPAPPAPPGAGYGSGENPGAVHRDAADPVTANPARAPAHTGSDPSIAPGTSGALGEPLAGLAAAADSTDPAAGAAPPETSTAGIPSPAAGGPDETSGRPHPGPQRSAAAGAPHNPPPDVAGPPAASSAFAPQIPTVPAGERAPSTGGSARPADGAPPDPALFAGQVAGAADPSPAAGADSAGKAQDAPQTPPPNLSEQLSGPLIGAVRDGRHDLALQLHPPGLGDVAVRIVVSGREVSAWFDSPQPQVQQAISQSIGDLHRDLATAGFDLSGAWVGGEAWTPR
ncbi:MAG TPA: flagellar hook-length control protein FliK, partial [Stellaceae bacterium]|nr:flagellar hook-length control protein FliK [Stellaceae bacterium]